MGLIKTAIIGGVAAYGVHEISKAAQNHKPGQNQDQNQRCNSNNSNSYNDDNNSSHFTPPARDAYNPAFQGQSAREFQDTCPDDGLTHQDDRGQRATGERPVIDSKKQRPASRGTPDEGSNQGYYRATGPYATYQDRPYFKESEYADYNSPPPYDQRLYPSSGPRWQGGFGEGEGRGSGLQEQQYAGQRGFGGDDFMGILGSQLGKHGLFDLVQGRSGRERGRKGGNGDGGLGRLGSLLVDMPHW